MPIEAESPEEIGYERITANLAESSAPDMRLSQLQVELGDLVLCYGDHRGHRPLRALLADGEDHLTDDNVLLTGGAAMALFIVATSLLGPEDHVIVARPNYATNIETPRAIGCDLSYLDLDFDAQYRVDPGQIASLMKHQTKLVSLTSPHNPTGVLVDESTLRQVIALVEDAGCLLLLDETYREMALGGQPAPLAASLSPRVISVSSMSKAYGLPGIRQGWLMTQDRKLMQLFLAAKEQITITGSILDEAIAYAVLCDRERHLGRINSHLCSQFEATRVWMEHQDILEWVEPQGGAVCFPRVKPSIALDIDRFYTVLMEHYGTFVGPGHWFEQSRRHMRIGFGWPSRSELDTGLANITAALGAALSQ